MYRHIISVDLEDWPQSCLDYNLPITPNVIDNTGMLLDLFDKYGVKATFFCLGLVAEKYPELIRKVHNDGHEIGTHGWSHRSVKELGPDKFKSELVRSIKVLEDICGQQVRGHRAPDFSIDLDMHWAFDIMREAGLDYDSSIFPINGGRYGSPDSPVYPYGFQNGLWEYPLSTVKIMKRKIPILGGGYFRLFPYNLSRRFLRMIEKESRPAVVYIHPYELNCQELHTLEVSRKTRLHQGLFRSRVALRLKKLFKEFAFGSMADYQFNMNKMQEDCSHSYSYLMIQNPVVAKAE
ncbi:MAG: DUF3473 domain-containing protein [candidate division Zixibacteria bacterium]|nr:DUF3473 domain-containing protein [candidate division Zixibacteria bacterium]